MCRRDECYHQSMNYSDKSTIKEQEGIRSMKTNAATRLTERIRREYGLTYEAALDKAEQVLEGCPEVLTQNVEEWSKGEKLTDIYVGKYSMPMILAIWGSRDFLKALEVMAELAKGSTEIAELKIWNMRR